MKSYKENADSKKASLNINNKINNINNINNNAVNDDVKKSLKGYTSLNSPRYDLSYHKSLLKQMNLKNKNNIIENNDISADNIFKNMENNNKNKETKKKADNFEINVMRKNNNKKYNKTPNKTIKMVDGLK
jgi:hypothetical protein